MIHDEFVEVEEPEALFTNPLPALLTGLGGTFAAWVLSLALPALTVVWAPVLLVGLLSAGAAICIKPKSPVVLGGAALAAILAALVSNQSQWDFSATIFFGVLAGVSAFCTALVLLPRTAQKIVVSLVILFHFMGILSAVTSAPPGSWLSHQAWMRLFRPYLEFMYLNNAYHFYAPDPGPAVLLWCFVEYEPDVDEKGNITRRYYRWLKIPDLDENGRAIDYDAEGNPRRYPNVNYTRRLSLVEGVNMPGPTNPPGDAMQRRINVGAVASKAIPPMPTNQVPLHLQYREPGTLAKHWLASYAKRIAATYKHADHPDKKFKSVKIYKVLHRILPPDEVKQGRDMYDPLTYEPVFMGEYNEKGELQSHKLGVARDDNGHPYIDRKNEMRDPYLYWVIPILDESRAALGIYAAPVKDGIEIDVMRGRAAYRAGLHSGDVIVAVDGHRLVDLVRRQNKGEVKPADLLDMLRREIQKHNPTDTVVVRIRRDGEERDVDVPLMRRVINYLKIHAGEHEEGVQL